MGKFKTRISQKVIKKFFLYNNFIPTSSFRYYRDILFGAGGKKIFKFSNKRTRMQTQAKCSRVIFSETYQKGFGVLG